MKKVQVYHDSLRNESTSTADHGTISFDERGIAECSPECAAFLLSLPGFRDPSGADLSGLTPVAQAAGNDAITASMAAARAAEAVPVGKAEPLTPAGVMEAFYGWDADAQQEFMSMFSAYLAKGESSGSSAGTESADAGGPQLRDDGPTLVEFLAAGYKAENYPPDGYAAKDSTIADLTAFAEKNGIKVPSGPKADIVAAIEAATKGQ